MENALPAVGFFSAIAGGLYWLGRQADEILTKEAKKKYFVDRRYPLSTALKAITPLTLSTIDAAVRYRQKGYFWLPSIGRSIVFSFTMLLVFGYPLNSLLDKTPGLGALGVALKTYLSKTFESGAVLSLVYAALTMNFLVDYLSFVKTRTVIGQTRRMPFFRRAVLVVFADLFLSVVICLLVYLIGWYILIFVAYLGLMESFLEYSGLVLNIAWRSFVLTTPILIVAFVTSLGIAAITFLLTLIDAAYFSIRAVEKAKLWSALNFKNKPMQISAVAAIVAFSIIYWPIILLIGFL